MLQLLQLKNWKKNLLSFGQKNIDRFIFGSKKLLLLPLLKLRKL
jgi:hypothetical protein